jgi:hypothetical protein
MNIYMYTYAYYRNWCTQNFMDQSCSNIHIYMYVYIYKYIHVLYIYIYIYMYIYNQINHRFANGVGNRSEKPFTYKKAIYILEVIYCNVSWINQVLIYIYIYIYIYNRINPRFANGVENRLEKPFTYKKAILYI